MDNQWSSTSMNHAMFNAWECAPLHFFPPQVIRRGITGITGITFSCSKRCFSFCSLVCLSSSGTEGVFDRVLGARQRLVWPVWRLVQNTVVQNTMETCKFANILRNCNHVILVNVRPYSSLRQLNNVKLMGQPPVSFSENIHQTGVLPLSGGETPTFRCVFALTGNVFLL